MSKILGSAVTEHGIKEVIGEYLLTSPEKIRIVGNKIYKDSRIMNHITVKRQDKKIKLELVDIT